jgi:membrane fusion protein (multidrug efflux system)
MEERDQLAKDQLKKDELKKDRKKPVVLGTIILIVLLVTGLILGIYWALDTAHYIYTDDAAIDGQHVTVSAKMLARIKALLVAEGAKVQEGQLLVQLDDADLRAQESQAVASLNYMNKNLVLARVNREKAKEDFDRSKNLFDSGATSREQYDHSLKAVDIANAQYSIALAQIETSEAQLRILETQLQNTAITAPISGSVAKQSVQQGDVVQPGQAIFTVNDLENIWITANFKETKIRYIRTNASVKVTVDAYPDRKFSGKVFRIAAGIVAPAFTIGDFTKTTQRIPVKILLENQPGEVILLPGMSVEVKISRSDLPRWNPLTILGLFKGR